jgi:hypothetical protein
MSRPILQEGPNGECLYCGIVRDEPCSRFCSQEKAAMSCSTWKQKAASPGLDDNAWVHEPGPRRAYVPREWLAFAHEVIGCCEAVAGPIGELAKKARELVATTQPTPRRMQAIKDIPNLMAKGSFWVEIRPNVFRPAIHPEGDAGLDFNYLGACGYPVEKYLAPVTPRAPAGKSACGECGRVCEPCSDYCGNTQVPVARREIRG